MSLSGGLFQFLAVCIASAFACTAIKEAEGERLMTQTARLFGVLAGGIVVFGLVVQTLTTIAS